jgi:anti-anti-sigma factor
MTQDGFLIVGLGMNRLQLSGELDRAAVPVLREALESFPGELTLDLSELTFADSVGLQAILERSPGVAITLVGVRPIVMKVLKLMGFLDGRSGLVIEPIWGRHPKSSSA